VGASETNCQIKLSLSRESEARENENSAPCQAEPIAARNYSVISYQGAFTRYDKEGDGIDQSMNRSVESIFS
jgi:hypothetical protein